MHKVETKIRNLHLGEETKLHEILELVDSSLVGSFLGRIIGSGALKDWIWEKIKPMIGYPPRSISMVRGWMLSILNLGR